MRDAIQVLQDISKHGGRAYVTAKDTSNNNYTDRTPYSVKLGAIKEGFSFEYLDENSDTFTGDPLELVRRDKIKIGLQVKLTCLEVRSTEQMLMALGYGTSTVRALDAAEAITNHPFYIWGHNVVDLPYRNITLTKIRDLTPATPVEYTGADITTNFEVGSVNATIRLKEASAATHIENRGMPYDCTGTWSRPRQQVLEVGSDDIDDEAGYWSLLILANKAAGGYDKGILIPKAYTDKPSGREIKIGTDRAVEITFTSAMLPSCSKMWYEWDDTPTS